MKSRIYGMYLNTKFSPRTPVSQKQSVLKVVALSSVSDGLGTASEEGGVRALRRRARLIHVQLTWINRNNNSRPKMEAYA